MIPDKTQKLAHPAELYTRRNRRRGHPDGGFFGVSSLPVDGEPGARAARRRGDSHIRTFAVSNLLSKNTK
jgi:hypothetical protein